MPPDAADRVAVGTRVRVALHGRRVGGWVLEDGVEPEVDPVALRPLAKVSSDGPPPDVVALTGWAARRWAGPRSSLLRAASPANNVAPGSTPDAPAVATPGFEVTVRRWAPATRMADLLRGLVSTAGSTLVVIPDAGRVRALGAYFHRAGLRTVASHGSETGAERTAAWTVAREGRGVVVGGRVAVWAPVPDLAAVVLVDDADEAMKEERSPMWHARDVALERARRAGVPVTIVSPAPTLEALAVAGEVVVPTRTPEREGWGTVVVLDRRDDPPGSGMFSPGIVGPLRQGVPTGRVVCVLNRKGRARLLACGSCRRVVCCEVCGGAMAEDTAEDGAGLACRTCGATRPRVCAACGSTVLRRLQPGIRRMREELEALLHGVEVAEVDAATEDLPDAPVLVGTEAVLHRVERAAVVAFLDFDQELLAPRFRAAEQALWLLVRAVRLAGGRGDGGRVLVQTRMPDHEVVRAAVHADPGVVVEAERARRRLLGYPPYGALAEVEGDAAAVEAMAGHDVTVLGGPARFLVRAADHDVLAGALAAARHAGRLRAHVDPLRT